MTQRYLPDSDTFAILDRARKLVKGELYEI
jgi:hypothetical protein